MRYINEISRDAFVQSRAQREAAMHGDRIAQEHLTTVGGAHWGAPIEDLFDAIAVGIGRGRFGSDAARVTASVSALFGEAEAAEIVRLCDDVFEEVETQARGRLDRIVRRITHRRAGAADVAYLDVEGQDPAAAAELAPVEPRRAA